MNNLNSNETSLKGSWVMRNGVIVADAISERIEFLVQNSLKMLAKSEDGWDRLFIDPKDSRYWEIIYDDSEQHGGGAPHLKYLSNVEASEKYVI